MSVGPRHEFSRKFHHWKLWYRRYDTLLC